MKDLNKDTFASYCISSYDNPQCSTIEEFEEDCKRLNYLKKLFNRYKETNELKDRLILNHLIVLYNVFGTVATTRLLFFKLEGYYTYLVPFLIVLNRLPEVVRSVAGKNIITSEISLDKGIVGVLRERNKSLL